MKLDLPWNRPSITRSKCDECKKIFEFSKLTGGKYNCIIDFECNMLLYEGKLCTNCEQKIADLHEKEEHSAIDII